MMSDCKNCSAWLGEMHKMNKEFIDILKEKEAEIARLQKECNDKELELIVLRTARRHKV